MVFFRIVLFFLISTLYVNCFAADYLREAQQYISKGEYRAAIIQLKNQLKAHPRDAQARHLLGTLYLQQSQFKAAEKELGKASQYSPDNILYKLGYSKVLLLLRDYQQVIKILDFSSEGDNENLRQLYLGYANFGLNQIMQAKQSFQFAVDKDFAEGHIGLAKIALLEKDYDLANRHITKLLSTQPDNMEGQQIHAKILNFTQQYRQALDIYNFLIEKNSTNQSYFLERASTHLALKDFESANQDIQVVLKKNKKHPFANYLLAQIRLKQKDYEAARDAAQVVLNISTHHFPSKLIIGIANYGLGNLNQADKYLTEFLSSQPDNLGIQDLLANVYLGQKKPQQAVLMLESIDEEKRDNHPQITTTLGSAYLLMGEHQKGIELLNKAKALDPDNLMVQKRLVAGQLQGGDRSSGIAGLEKVAKLEPENKKVHYLLLISYIQDKKIAKAEKKIAEMLKADTKDPVVYNFKSVIESIKGNKEQAKQAYQDALVVDKKYIPAHMGLAKFAYSEGDEEKAVQYFKQVIQINKKYLASFLALASIAEKNKQNGQAEQYLLTAYQNNKGNLRSQLKLLSLLGKWYAKFEQPEKLLPLAHDLMKQHPENLSAMSFLAGAQMVNGKNGEAEKNLKNIVARNIRDSKHRILLANLIAKQPGRKIEVLKLLDEVYAMDNTKSQALGFQVNYLIKLKEYSQALEIAKRIDRLFPAKATGKKLQGDVFWVQEQRDKAINLYREGYQKQPGVKSLFFLVELMLKDNKNGIALRFLKEELEKSSDDKPEHRAILLKIAATYQQLKQDQQAIKYYQQVLDLQEDNVLALNNLAWIYFTQENPKALKVAEKAYKLAPASAQVADTYAVILLEEPEQANVALKILQEATAKSPDDYDIQFHLSRAYELTGNNQQAIKTLSLISKSEKVFSEKEAAIALLNKLTN